MTFQGYKIQINKSWRTNQLSVVSLIMAIAGIYYAAIHSCYFVSYRLGDSIIPREDQLIRSGPYVVETQKARIGFLVIFQPITGREHYSQSSTEFSNSVNHLVQTMKGKSVAYLWLYKDNPIRSIWRIDINDETVFSYENALKFYRIESNPTIHLLIAFGCFVLFFWTLVTITPSKREKINKLEE